MAEFEVQGSSLNITGAVTFETVTADVKQAKKKYLDGKFVSVNFAGLRECDSACLAFMLELLRFSKEKVTFDHLPKVLLPLIKLSELQTIFSVSDDA